MDFFKKIIKFSIGLIAVYFLGYLYEYDFGFAYKINVFLTETIHFFVFALFGFLTCSSVCVGDKTKKSGYIYVFGAILVVAVIGVFNEVRVHPEGHSANIRDMIMHFTGGTLGVIVWRLFKISSDEKL